MSLQPGTRVGNYEVLSELGSGGTGHVYRARHCILDNEVALKVLAERASPERFLREAKLLAKVRSPYVVAVHDFDHLEDGSQFLAMELVRGNDLASLIVEESRPLDEQRCIEWMRHVSKGMRAAAAQGIVHRDLKPANILIDEEDIARVADFGVARTPTVAVDLSFQGQLLGTPYYMAPEQAQDPRRVDTRADIYSFGATFYHAMAGSPPFDGDTVLDVLVQHRLQPLISPVARYPMLSDHMSEVLERCLAKSPRDRFGSFEELLLQIDRTAESPWTASDDPRLAECLNRFRAKSTSYLARFGEDDTYEFSGGRVLHIVHGSIVDQEIDAIVSSDDDRLSMSGGVSWAIRQAAGRLVEDEARRYVPVRPGRAVVTSAGKLKSRFIFHGITMPFDEGSFPSRDLIIEIAESCFYHADSLGVRSIAFPLLGSGAGKLSPDVCLGALFSYLARKLSYEPGMVQEVRIVLR